MGELQLESGVWCSGPARLLQTGFTGYRGEKVPKNILRAEGACLSRLFLGEEYEKHFPLPKSLHQFQEREQSTQIQKPNSTPQNTKYLYVKWCSCKSDRISTAIKSL